MTRVWTSAALLLCGAFQVQQPTFRARVDHVLVDVVVTDRNDRPVTDLTAADFQIVENGRPQKITDFQFVSIPVSAAPRAGEGEPGASRALPDVGTNAPPSPNSRLFVLVIDDLHIIEAEIVRVKGIVTDFITKLAPDDEVGIVFTGRSDLGINVTNDRGRLLPAIDRIRDALGFGVDALGRSNGGGGVSPMSHARSAAFTLRNVARALGSSTHPRRAIVYVSAGSPVDLNAPPRSPEFMRADIVREDMKLAFAAARTAGVPVYTLDPRGLVLPEDAIRGHIAAARLHPELAPPGRSGVGIAAAGGSESPGSEITRRIRIQHDALSATAINTGGRAFINQSDLSRAVNEIVAENGSYYLLAYSPEPLPRDGKFHEIKIKVTRDGVRVRGRSGYVATSAKPAAVDPGETLAAAMTSGINVSGIGLRAVATPLAQGEKGMLTAVTLQVTYPMVPGSTAPIDDVLRVGISGLDGDAKVKASSEHVFTFKARPMDRDNVTFLVNGLVELPAQPLTLRIGLASRTLGRAGMVQIPIEAPKRSDSKLRISGVAIGVEGRVEPALGAELIQALVPFQPTTTRAFASADTLRLFTRLFWESSASPEGLRHQAELVFGVTGLRDIAPRAIPLSAIAEGNRRQASFETSLPLRTLVPGDYVLHVEARLPDGQTARRDVPFSVR